MASITRTRWLDVGGRLPLDSTVALILGGGRGTRLYPLTEQRSKPAVPLAGKYRLIDIPISNCINSRLRKIFVLTQYQSASLNRHVNASYQFDVYSRGFVEVMAAEQTETSQDWYQGTADAVRRQLRHFQSTHPSHYLILSGDQLYRMDFRDLLAHHVASGAHVTVSTTMVGAESTGALGLIKMNEASRIQDIAEKPQDPAVVERFRLDTHAAKDLGADPTQETYLASMGIYVFDAECLHELLAQCDGQDFGRNVLPAALENFRLSGYVFRGYWEDIGTIGSFFRANLMLTRRFPPFDFHDTTSPVYTHARYLPPAKLYTCHVRDVLVSDGAIIEQAHIEDSLIGIRSVVQDGARLERVVMMGADEYDIPLGPAGEKPSRSGVPPRGVGPNTIIRQAIIDKNARIGRDVRIENVENLDHADGPGWSIREGIVVIKRDAVIPDGTVI